MRLEQLETHAVALMREHGLGAWVFAWDRAVRRAGRCMHSGQRITVSRVFAEEASTMEFEQVMLHEIAHALAGHAAGHGPAWQRIARNIGYVGGRTLGWEFARHRAPWLGKCPSGHETVRFRRPRYEVSCGQCEGAYNPAHRITWYRVA